MSVKIEAPVEPSLEKYFARYAMLNTLRQLMNTVRMPTASHAIHREECMYTYDSPESESGLYVNLTTFIGFSEEFLHEYVNRTGLRVFLHIRREKLPQPEPSAEAEMKKQMATPAQKITQMAQAVAKGQTAKNMADYKTDYHVVVLPDRNVNMRYPDCEIQHVVVETIEEILRRPAITEEIIQSTSEGRWPTVVEHRITRFSDSLQQLERAEPVKPTGLKCATCGCLTNIWMNLSDGKVHCSSVPKADIPHLERDHAYQHFMATGYPLIIRLNTINSDTPPAVFSFVAGTLVKDVNLRRHLRRFGIVLVPARTAPRTDNQQQMELNDRMSEWYVLTEMDNSNQVIIRGPGYTGMRNMANTCYLNATMQLIFAICDFVTRFSGDGASLIFRKYIADPLFDFNLQMAKLGHGLMSGRYCSDGITPALFKHLVCDDHPVLKSPDQQDAYLFYQALINMVNKAFPSTASNPAAALKILFEDCYHIEEDDFDINTPNTVVDSFSKSNLNNIDDVDHNSTVEHGSIVDDDQSAAVDLDETEVMRKYKHFDDYCIRLPIPVTKLNVCDDDNPTVDMFAQDSEFGHNTIKPILRQKISFRDCMEAFFKTTTTGKLPPVDAHIPTTAYNTRRLCNMPDYVMIQLCKFITHDDWTPKKLDVDIDMPWRLDLNEWRSDSGRSATEEAPFKFNEVLLGQLTGQGFTREAAKRACFYTMNFGFDAARTWLKLHGNDNDLDMPFDFPINIIDTTLQDDDSATLKVLTRMGFNRYYAQLAVFETDGTLEQATKWLLAHEQTVHRAPNPEFLNEVESMRSSNPQKYRDGVGLYDLIGFVSHMGTSSQVGHYVCHVLKDDEWVLFDDLRVVKSVHPPKNFGYLYLYKRYN